MRFGLVLWIILGIAIVLTIADGIRQQISWDRQDKDEDR